MADIPGQTSKANDPKPEAKPEPGAKATTSRPEAGETGRAETGAAGRSAAVKPPVLDLKAREARPESTKPESTKPDAGKRDIPKASGKPPGDKSAAPSAGPQPKNAAGIPTLAAVLGGGALGLAAAYGLAWAGLWPTPAVAPPPEDPRLAQFGSSLGELETVTSTTQSELAALNQRIAALETAEPSPVAPAEPVDIAGIEADIAALSGRIDALSTAPAPEVDTQALAGIEEQLGALGGRIDELAARLGTAEAGLQTLDTAVAQTTRTLSSQPEDIGAVLQLPLIVSGLEAAFSQGRPYESELAALRQASPDLTIPPAVIDAAPSGLERPDAIAAALDAALPAMLASRPSDPDAGWQQGAFDRLSSSIALRPTTEMQGDAPEAVLSRLEAAVARRDFVTADELMRQLPEPMQAAAGSVAGSIAAQAEAQRLLADVRAGAFAGGEAQ